MKINTNFDFRLLTPTGEVVYQWHEQIQSYCQQPRIEDKELHIDWEPPEYGIKTMEWFYE